MEKKILIKRLIIYCSQIFIIMALLIMPCFAIAMPSTQASADNSIYTSIGFANYSGSINSCKLGVIVCSNKIDCFGDNIEVSSSGFGVKVSRREIRRVFFAVFNYMLEFELVKDNEVVASFDFQKSIKKITGDVVDVFNESHLSGSGEYVVRWRGTIASYAIDHVSSECIVIVG